MSYDLSSYSCAICKQPITMKEFADGKAGRCSGNLLEAAHETCMIGPAIRRPGMYAGPQGSRTKAQWILDAVEVYKEFEGVQMR